MSGILVETVVKTTLKDLKEDPERSIRKLVDLALNFSENRFQKHFFGVAQTMLQNESSAYYGLIRDLTSYADIDRLLNFGMNVGYHSCTCGAQKIRDNEKMLEYNIPWTIMFQMNDQSFSHFPQYNAAIADGEKLGIYTWMIFSQSAANQAFDLAHAHPDSAFFLFCESEEISEGFMDDLSEQKNIMPVIRYEEGCADVYTMFRELGIPYSVSYWYSQDDLDSIINGDLLASTQQVHPAFTVLIPHPSCPDTARKLTHQAIERIRNEQWFQTIPWELERDNQTVDKIISGDSCAISFDTEGFFRERKKTSEKSTVCLFKDGLNAVLRASCSKTSETVAN